MSAFTNDKKAALNQSLPKRNKEHWIEGEFVIFQVEQELFRVPSYMFTRNSEVFAGMFNLPQGGAGSKAVAEGSREDKPIILSGIQAKHFSNFLKALYPQSIFGDLSVLTPHEWNSVLKLSTMWYMLDLRAEAITRLNCVLTPASKVSLGRKYSISAFFRNGLESLLRRQTPLTDEEAELIGPMTTVALFRLREAQKSVENSSHNMGYGLISVKFERKSVDTFERIFGEELEAIKRDEEGYYKV